MYHFIPVDWLNYHHLLYFWVIAPKGSMKPTRGMAKVSQPENGFAG